MLALSASKRGESAGMVTLTTVLCSNVQCCLSRATEGPVHAKFLLDFGIYPSMPAVSSEMAWFHEEKIQRLHLGSTKIQNIPYQYDFQWSTTEWTCANQDTGCCALQQIFHFFLERFLAKKLKRQWLSCKCQTFSEDKEIVRHFFRAELVAHCSLRNWERCLSDRHFRGSSTKPRIEEKLAYSGWYS